MTVLGDNDKFIRASMDHEFNVGSEAHIPLGKGVMGKLNVQLGKQDMVMGTASYAGIYTFNGLQLGEAGAAALVRTPSRIQ